MALTFTNNISKATRTGKLVGGLKVAQIEMTVGATGDYSSGYDLNTNAAKMGFSKIFDVLTSSARASNGTLRAQFGVFDHNTGKLRFYLQGAANGATATSAGVFTEITAATHTAASDVVRMTLIGV